MKKNKLKKLALMGITGGVILSNQGLKADESSLLDESQVFSQPSLTNNTLKRRNGCGGCGGKHGCGGGGGSQDQGMNQYNNGGEQNQQMYPSDHGQGNGMQKRESMNYEPESEEEFTQQLGSEGKRLYNSLSEEGKQLARRLAKQYADKSQAVRHAARQMQQNEGTGSPLNKSQRYN